jgi:hypothetical protein
MFSFVSLAAARSAAQCETAATQREMADLSVSSMFAPVSTLSTRCRHGSGRGSFEAAVVAW